MKKVIIALTLTLAFAGCAKKVPIHPGALNQADSAAYDTLLTAQAALEQAKVECASLCEAHPGSKDMLNQAIAAYNQAEADYAVYHSVGAGDFAHIQGEIQQVISSIAGVQKAFGKQVTQ